MIPKQIVDQIFDTARVEEVVGDFVQLKKAGANYKGLSPFNNERTPSFVVSPSKNIWKDFSSGKGGNAVNFLMEHEQLSFPEALRYLAKKYNITIPEERERTPEELAEANERESLMLVNKFAAEYFSDQLHNSEKGKAIGLSYLKERGLSEKTITEFRLGYCPDEGAVFSKAAIDKGYQLKYLETTGLTRTRNDQPYDFFRGRVMFPILSVGGAVLGFGGRTMKSGDKMAKYFNSPESPVYHKSKTLYGIHQAKSEMVKTDACYLVEGYTDVISLHQAGITNVVAASGTSLTTEQVQLVRRYTNNITILFDGDPAGIKASFRSIDLVLQEGMSVRIVLLPEGQDPDSFARAHSNSELKEFLAKNARDFVEFKTEIMMAEAANDPIKKAAVIKDIVGSIAQIPDHITRSVYIQSCSSRLQIEEQTLKNELDKLLRTSFRKAHQISREEVPEAEPRAPRQHGTEPQGLMAQETELMRLLLNYGQQEIEVTTTDAESGESDTIVMLVCDVIIGEIIRDELKFEHFLFQRIFTEYNELREDDSLIPDPTYFTRHSDPHISRIAVDLLSTPHVLSEHWEQRYKIYTITEDQKLRDAVMDGIYTYKLRRVIKMIAEDEEKLKKATSDAEYIPLLERKVKLDQIKMRLAEFSGSIIV